MGKKRRVSGWFMPEHDHVEIEKAAERMGISIPVYVKIKALEVAKKENKKAELEE